MDSFLSARNQYIERLNNMLKINKLKKSKIIVIRYYFVFLKGEIIMDWGTIITSIITAYVTSSFAYHFDNKRDNKKEKQKSYVEKPYFKITQRSYDDNEIDLNAIVTTF